VIRGARLQACATKSSRRFETSGGLFFEIEEASG